MTLKLTILGMNGPYPAPDGCCSGYLVRTENTCLQMDMGCGTLAALQKEGGVCQLTALVLTHWHNDHCSDVLPLIYALESAIAAGKRGPLTMYAPGGVTSPVYDAVKSCAAIELHEVEPGDTFTVGDIAIATLPARHPVKAMMLRLCAEDKTLCYTGDTNTMPTLLDYARGADLLLADGLFATAMWQEGKPHLSAAHCAQLAVDAQVGQLIITHLNPDVDAGVLLNEARAIRPDAQLARCGMTVSL